jgi:hypothetical protein
MSTADPVPEFSDFSFDKIKVEGYPGKRAGELVERVDQRQVMPHVNCNIENEGTKLNCKYE